MKLFEVFAASALVTAITFAHAEDATPLSIVQA